MNPFDQTTQKDFLSGPQGPSVIFSPGEIIAERFRIIRKIGEGGMAVVYEAVDDKLGERRALKFAKAGYLGQIPPETRSALRVTHDNICRTYEIHTAENETPPVDFISMEFLEGENLQSRSRRSAVPQGEALEIARQLCHGVEAAHRAQILHRDLKGNNVMLTRRPDGSMRVVITDFGLAKLAADGAAPTSSAFAGTPDYIAPERWKGVAATPASDVYALGVILYEMLAGRLPFAPETPDDIRRTSLPEAPSESGRAPDFRWDPIVLGCLHPDPEKRYSSGGEVLRAMENAFAISHRRKWIAAAAAIFLAAISAFYFRDALFPPPPLARLAVLPFTGSADSELNTAVRGGLSDVAARLAVLGAESRRLVIIPPEEAQTYRADSPALAASRLGASHALSGEVEARGDTVVLHAAITELSTGNILRQFDGQFQPADMASLSTSLAGVVTSAFRLRAAPAASILPGAYSEYAHGLALVRRDLSSYEEAIRHFEAAQTLDPQSPLVFAGLAEAYSQKFRTTRDVQWLRQAAAAAERAESMQPDSVSVLLVRSAIDQTDGKPEQAVGRLRRAAELEPNNSEVWRQIGLALERSGGDEEALAALRKSTQLAPDYFRPHRDLGSFYFRKGRAADAFEEFRLVTRLVPELPEGHADLGGALLVVEKEDEAEAALRQSLKLRETRAALNNLGVLLRYQKRDAEAEPVMQHALAAGADDAGLRLNLANTLRHLGRAAEARENYQRANELARSLLLRDPRDAASRARLAYSLVQLGMPALAADEALQAVRLAGSDYATLYSTLMTLDALGRRADAYPLLANASQEQLRDLRRQPDLADFARDPRFPHSTKDKQ